MTIKIKQVKQSAIDMVRNTATGQSASDRQMKAAVKLVTSGKVHVYDQRTLLVESQSEAGLAYELIKGKHACACRYGQTGRVCAHRLAAALYYCCTTPALARLAIDAANPLGVFFPEVA